MMQPAPFSLLFAALCVNVDAHEVDSLNVTTFPIETSMNDNELLVPLMTAPSDCGSVRVAARVEAEPTRDARTHAHPQTGVLCLASSLRLVLVSSITFINAWVAPLHLL